VLGRQKMITGDRVGESDTEGSKWRCQGQLRRSGSLTNRELGRRERAELTKSGEIQAVHYHYIKGRV